jgi:hypothetical protein
MRIQNSIKIYAKVVIILVTVCFNSCDYLDVVPPEQANTDDMMIDDQTTLRNLYACYGYLQNGGADLPFAATIDGTGSDEAVMPQEWQRFGSRVQWNAITPSSINEDNNYPWVVWYNAIGYCNQFLKLIEENNPTLNPNDKEQYKAEVKFLKAYYHFRALQMFGPIPIIDEFQSSNISKNEIPGRFHFDYCVDYIVDLLDEAVGFLPTTHSNPQYYGRATTVICKALKSRVLLFAASPLWNGSFPHRTWKNDKFETPGYGKELVSFEYDSDKWVRAREACLEAIKAAESIGATLFDLNASETLRKNQQVPLPQVPNLNLSTEEGERFQQRVMMLRYMNTARPDQGNKEIIWGITLGTNENMRMSSLPHYILVNNQNVNVGGWGGLSPTLYTVEHFFTKNGKLPSEDATFANKTDWFKSAGLSNSDIINLNVDREPRFYAWISFDGDEYSTVAANRSPIYCEMRNPKKTGYDAAIWGTRNYSVTGFLNKKWVHPNFNYTGTGWNSNVGECIYPITIIRLGELYLNLAECDAHLGGSYTTEALEYLNKIRERAGVPDWTESSLAQMNKSLLDAILEERFVELYMEGHRYYDLRRYVKAADYLNKNAYMGLNAVLRAPTFEVFNTPIEINQPFGWNDCMYLMPISNRELYANPQMIQAPGY